MFSNKEKTISIPKRNIHAPWDQSFHTNQAIIPQRSLSFTFQYAPNPIPPACYLLALTE